MGNTSIAADKNGDELAPVQPILQHAFPQEAFCNYDALLGRVNLLCAHLTSIHHLHLQCRSGCSLCCRNDIYLAPVEAFRLKARFNSLSEEIRAQIKYNLEADHACPLLHDDQCLLYETRSIICRTHGLPHLYTFADGDMIIDYCELNFTQINKSFVFAQGETVDLHNLNTALAAVNLVFLRDYADDGKIPPDVRIAISDVCAYALGGKP